MITKPLQSKAPQYFQNYIAQCSESDMIEALEHSMDQTIQLYKTLNVIKENHRYAADKWTMKEVLVHLIDCERIFAYRAWRFSRKDATNLHSFDENMYIPNSNTEGRALHDVIDEFTFIRKSSIIQFEYFTNDMLDYEGQAGTGTTSARDLGWMIAGHNYHHLRILLDRYM